MEALMERHYLEVPREEYADAEAAGAAWDGDSRRWYVPADGRPRDLARWWGDDPDDVEFGLTSEEAYVASAAAACTTCRADIEVICLYCDSAIDETLESPLERVTISNIWAMDAALMEQLAPWPSFKRIAAGEGVFANHCVHCGAVQDEQRLHAEPGDVFFSVADAEPGSIGFAVLSGRVRMSGDHGFGV